MAGDFSRACANCHQIGDFRWREPRTRDEWRTVINRMIGYGGIPFYQETRDVLLDTIASTFSPDAPEPHFDVPPPPSGEVLRAVIREWEIDPVSEAGLPRSRDRLGRNGLHRERHVLVQPEHRRACALPARRRRPFGRAPTRTATCGSPLPAQSRSSSSTSPPRSSPASTSRASATISAPTRTRCTSMPRGASGTR